jgi:hypothetical protein
VRSRLWQSWLRGRDRVHDFNDGICKRPPTTRLKFCLGPVKTSANEGSLRKFDVVSVHNFRLSHGVLMCRLEGKYNGRSQTDRK